MKAVYCDICKKYFPENKTRHIQIIGLFNEDLELDLCEKDENRLVDMIDV